MDEQTRALYQQLLGELYRRMEKDPEIRRALRRIEEGKATFRDTAIWSDRSAELLGDVLSGSIADMPAEARESLCKALLRERYDSTFDLCGEVQEALDERLGISLKPVKPKFPAERVQQIAHSLLDPTVAAAVIERRARAPVATAARSFHDDYIRENASARTDLGFKCYLDRIAAPGCCKWCTSVAGKYIYGNHPDDIFRRHDNCACTVTFENGRERQDVWSKRTWDARDPEEVERLAQEPVVYSAEESKILENVATDQLTKPGKGDIIYTADTDSDQRARILYMKMTPQERAEVIMRGIREPDPTFSYDRKDNKAMSYLKKTAPEPNTFDVRSHGNYASMEFFKQDYPDNDNCSSIDPYTLATILRGRDDFQEFVSDCRSRGVDPVVRLLSCSTGDTTNTGDCFAQLLANELGMQVKAPNKVLLAHHDGSFEIGRMNSGEMKPFWSRK